MASCKEDLCKETVEQLDLKRRFGMWGDVGFLALPSVFVSFLILAGLRMTQMLCKNWRVL